MPFAFFTFEIEFVIRKNRAACLLADIDKISLIYIYKPFSPLEQNINGGFKLFNTHEKCK